MPDNPDLSADETLASLQVYVPMIATTDLDVPNFNQLYSEEFSIYFHRAFNTQEYLFNNLIHIKPQDVLKKVSKYNWQQLKFKMQLKKFLQSHGLTYDDYRSIYFHHQLDSLYITHQFTPDSRIVIHENDFYNFKSSTLATISISPLSHTFLHPKYLHYTIHRRHVKYFKMFLVQQFLPRLKRLRRSHYHIPTDHDPSHVLNQLLLDSTLCYLQIFQRYNL